jgi:hypothetical protein
MRASESLWKATPQWVFNMRAKSQNTKTRNPPTEIEYIYQIKRIINTCCAYPGTPQTPPPIQSQKGPSPHRKFPAFFFFLYPHVNYNA